MDDIDALELTGHARRGAIALREKHPEVKFTSGRRNAHSQARAMSQNVAQNRDWIEQTYRHSEAALLLQGWIDANPHKKTAREIEDGLYAVMLGMPAVTLSKLSKHLSGEAFDVQPVPGDEGAAIKATIAGLPGLDKFLEKEGGLTRWHAQFKSEDDAGSA